MACYPCNPCAPDMDGPCLPCSPCGPDCDGPCLPCTPCAPDTGSLTTSCWPCSPCSPDEGVVGVHCLPCSPCGPDSSPGSSDGGGGCFLTSACTESLELPDDCFELQTLRDFRNRMVGKDKTYKSLVDDYYAIAPRIVRAINASRDASVYWRRLYDCLVAPCVRLICEGRDDRAWTLYRRVVKVLRARWMPR